MSDTKQIAEWLRGHGLVRSDIEGQLWQPEDMSVLPNSDLLRLYESSMRDKARIAELETALRKPRLPEGWQIGRDDEKQFVMLSAPNGEKWFFHKAENRFVFAFLTALLAQEGE